MVRELLEAARSPLADSAKAALHREGLKVAHTLDASIALCDEGARLEALACAHEAACDQLDADERVVASVAQATLLKKALKVVAAGVLVLVGATSYRLATAPVDLAKGKPFTLSSKWADCHPEEGQCGGYPTRVAFHTNEEPSPWFLIDLGAPTSFSRLTIANRSDMAGIRAVPLVVEVSDNGAEYREVARQTQMFATWSPHVGPQVARWVRLRVDRTSVLHLEAVKIHP